jgi:hypothetical protein
MLKRVWFETLQIYTFISLKTHSQCDYFNNRQAFFY